MATHPITRALQAALLLSASCVAQSAPPQSPTPAPCLPPNQTTAKTPDKTSDQTVPTTPATKPCPSPAPAAKKPASAAEQFPFPGEPSKPKSPPDSPGSSAPPDSPHPATTTPSDAAAQHPFPTQPPPKLSGDDSSSSSSSGTGDPSANPGDSPATGDPTNPPEGTSVHRKLPKVKRVQTDDERVDEDLSVAKFYLNDENYQGAYLRAKDAVNIQPEYSAAHFTLAQIAQKMKKNDEAIAEFQTYLKLDPEGEKAKAAKKALAELQ
jgi:hypothetical protein